ncbi:MAG: dephospho-CoA kinase [Clostridia bacterium]|nr:dephospho-CoA kinase [Clostridia bacterium]
MANKAVALVGMCGSGKSVLTEFFTQLGWEKVYFGGVTVAQLKKQGLEINEANERAMREGLRKQYGMGAFALLLVEEIAQKLDKTNTVLDGLYSWSEYKILREKFGDDLVVLAITTNRSVRYQRLACREFRPLTAEQAFSRDVSEIENLEKGGPISIADYYIDNNGSVQDLKNQFDKFLEWLNR